MPPRADPVRDLHEAAANDEAWGQALRSLREAFGGNGAALMLPDDVLAGPGLAAGDNLDPASAAAYAAHYHRLDLWARAAALAGTNRVLLGEELVPDRQFRASAWLNEFLRRFDHPRLLVLSVPMPGVLGGRGFLSVYRGERQQAFGPREQAAARALLPHARNALLVRQQRLAMPSAAELGCLLRETTPQLAYLVDRHLRIIDMTRSAARLLAAGDPVRVESGRLIVHGVDRLAERVQQLLRRCDGAAGQTVAFVRAAKEWRLDLIDASPLSPSGDEAVGILVRAPLAHCGSASAEVLALRFGLSPAEARLAAALLVADSVNEATARLGVSSETVKTQLRNIRHKLGVRSTMALVRRLAFESS